MERMQRRITFVLGKAPRPGTVVAGAAAVLEDRGVACEVLLPHEREVDPRGVTADLVVHRGLSERATGLVAALAAAGVETCNPWGAVARLRDRAAVHRALGTVGVPTPEGVVQGSWAEVLASGRRGPVVVKAVTGPGRGRGVLLGPLPPDPPMAGPYLVEELVENDGTDRKLYVAGDRVAGLLKPSPLTGAGARWSSTSTSSPASGAWRARPGPSPPTSWITWTVDDMLARCSPSRPGRRSAPRRPSSSTR